MSTVMLLVGSVLCVAFYLYVYFAAEKPRKGTLEWIEMQEKPQMTRQGLLQKLKWTDILWCALTILLSYGVSIGLSACVDISILKTSLSSGTLLLTLLPLALTAALAYLLGRLLSGKVLVGLFPAVFLMFCVMLNSRSMESLLLLGCLLLLLAHFNGKGFGAWLSLVLSAVLLASAAWFTPALIFFAIPWLGTVLFGEILRIRQEDVSLWHLIFTLLAAVLSLGVAITVLNFPLFATDLPQAMKVPGCYTIFWQKFFATLPMEFLSVTDDMALVLTQPAACLLLAGVVIAVGGVCRRQTSAVILLLWTGAALVLAVLFPAIPLYPMAALVLAYATSRIHRRNYPGAAYTVACVPIILTLISTILILFGGIPL